MIRALSAPRRSPLQVAIASLTAASYASEYRGKKCTVMIVIPRFLVPYDNGTCRQPTGFGATVVVHLIHRPARRDQRSKNVATPKNDRFGPKIQIPLTTVAAQSSMQFSKGLKTWSSVRFCLLRSSSPLGPPS